MHNVDLKIYVTQLLNSFEESSDIEELGYDAIRADFDLDKDIYTDKMLREALADELEVVVEENMIKHDTPQITMDEYEKCINNVATRFILEDMIEKGLMEATFDTEQMENVYTLTEKGKRLIK